MYQTYLASYVSCILFPFVEEASNIPAALLEHQSLSTECSCHTILSIYYLLFQMSKNLYDDRLEQWNLTLNSFPD